MFDFFGWKRKEAKEHLRLLEEIKRERDDWRSKAANLKHELTEADALATLLKAQLNEAKKIEKELLAANQRHQQALKEKTHELDCSNKKIAGAIDVLGAGIPF